MTLEIIKNKLSVIKKKGFIKSLRKGPTGIGYTLEILLDLYENNIPLPDFGEVELKATRSNSKNMITLFTFNKKAWQMDPMEAIKKYGSVDKNGRLGLYYTMGVKPNGAGLFLNIDDEKIQVCHISGTIIISWKLASIQSKFEEKVKSVLLVKAQNEIRGGVEYFYFDRAKLLTGETTKEILKSKFQNEQLLVDLRLHDKGTMARNHGTGFRVYERDLEDLYEKTEEINF